MFPLFQNIPSLILVFLTSLFTNFGGSHFPSKIDHVNSYKSVIFTCLISGVVTWVYYQALLTSRLSTKVVEYPFHDIPSFSQSNYRYTQGQKSNHPINEVLQ